MSTYPGSASDYDPKLRRTQLIEKVLAHIDQVEAGAIPTMQMFFMSPKRHYWPNEHSAAPHNNIYNKTITPWDIDNPTKQEFCVPIIAKGKNKGQIFKPTVHEMEEVSMSNCPLPAFNIAVLPSCTSVTFTAASDVTDFGTNSAPNSETVSNPSTFTINHMKHTDKNGIFHMGSSLTDETLGSPCKLRPSDNSKPNPKMYITNANYFWETHDGKSDCTPVTTSDRIKYKVDFKSNKSNKTGTLLPGYTIKNGQLTKEDINKTKKTLSLTMCGSPFTGGFFALRGDQTISRKTGNVNTWWTAGRHPDHHYLDEYITVSPFVLPGDGDPTFSYNQAGTSFYPNSLAGPNLIGIPPSLGKKQLPFGQYTYSFGGLFYNYKPILNTLMSWSYSGCKGLYNESNNTSNDAQMVWHDKNHSWGGNCLTNNRKGKSIESFMLTFIDKRGNRVGSWDEMVVKFCTGQERLTIMGIPINRYEPGSGFCDTLMYNLCADSQNLTDPDIAKACQCIIEQKKIIRHFTPLGIPSTCLSTYCSTNKSQGVYIPHNVAQEPCNARICQQIIRVHGNYLLSKGTQELTCDNVLYDVEQVSEQGKSNNNNGGVTPSSIPIYKDSPQITTQTLSPLFYFALGFLITGIIALIFFAIRRYQINKRSAIFKEKYALDNY